MTNDPINQKKSWLLTNPQDFLHRPPFKQEPRSLPETLPPTNSSPQSDNNNNESASHFSSEQSFQTSNQQQQQNSFNTFPPCEESDYHYSLGTLDFLTDFPVADPDTNNNNVWGLNHDLLDAGGTAGFDGSGAWEANAELFDGSGFFFG